MALVIDLLPSPVGEGLGGERWLRRQTLTLTLPPVGREFSLPAISRLPRRHWNVLHRGNFLFRLREQFHELIDIRRHVSRYRQTHFPQFVVSEWIVVDPGTGRQSLGQHVSFGSIHFLLENLANCVLELNNSFL